MKTKHRNVWRSVCLRNVCYRLYDTRTNQGKRDQIDCSMCSDRMTLTDLESDWLFDTFGVKKFDRSEVRLIIQLTKRSQQESVVLWTWISQTSCWLEERTWDQMNRSTCLRWLISTYPRRLIRTRCSMKNGLWNSYWAGGKTDLSLNEQFTLIQMIDFNRYVVRLMVQLTQGSHQKSVVLWTRALQISYEAGWGTDPRPNGESTLIQMIDFNESETRLIVQLAPMVSQTTRCFVDIGSTNQLLDHLENRSGTKLTPQRIQSVPHRNLPIPIFCEDEFYISGIEPVGEQIQDQMDRPS